MKMNLFWQENKFIVLVVYTKPTEMTLIDFDCTLENCENEPILAIM